MSSEFNEQQLIDQAEAALGPVRLSVQDVIRGGSRFRTNVVRCRVHDTSCSLPSTVIVKQSNWKGEALADWVSLEFLNALQAVSDSHLVPRLFGGSQEHDLVVMEDLGSTMLSNLLLDGTDRASARDALLQCAQALGTLHTATIGEEERYVYLRDNLSLPVRRSTISGRMDRALTGFPDIVRSLGIGVEPDALHDIENIRVQLDSPEPFRAFIQGDLNPWNFLKHNDQIRLCDFGFSAYYNALVDGVYPLIYYFAHGDIGRFPDELLGEMFGVYREQLCRRCHAATQEEVLYPAIVAASAGWMAYILHQLPECMDQDKRRGVFTYRQSMIYVIDTFISISHRYGYLSPLSRVAERISSQLKSVWSCELAIVPYCTVFRQE